MKVNYTITELLDKSNYTESKYHEFIRSKTLSSGIYKLAVGEVDMQQPHTEDEVYYVIQGKGQFLYEKEVFDAEEGSIFYVPANKEHRFQNISEDMVILVFFAPAEYTNNNQ